MNDSSPKRARVLVTDPLHADAIALLVDQFEVTVRLSPSADELRELVRDVDVLVMRSAIRLDASIIERAERLKLVARAGVGVDNIDIAAAQRAGVTVFNVPDQSAGAVAEFTLGLILGLTRRIVLGDSQMRRGERRKQDLVGRELRGLTLGVIGLGRIGLLVARLAHAFGMRVLGAVANPDLARSQRLEREGIELTDIVRILPRADVLCLLVPLEARTRGMIAAPELAQMPAGSYLINVSRGGVVNEQDLYAALKSGSLAGAALDVLATEGSGNLFAELENVIVTPHIAAMTEQTQRRIGETVVATISAALAGAPIRNQVC